MLKAKSSSPLSNVKLSFFKSIKFWGLFAFLVVLAGLPVALYEVQQQQTSQQHAATENYPNMDVCGNLVAISPKVAENPVCGTPSNPVASTSFDQYSTDVSVQNQGSATITVTFTWEKYWCNYKSSAGLFCGGPDDPNHSGTTHTQQTKTVTLAKGDTVDLPSGINQAKQACGTFQNDLTFSYTLNGKRCGPGNHSTGVSFSTMNWGFCQTSNPLCAMTPTPTVSPTITPTTTITPTETITPTDIPSDTPSPTASPSATPTSTPPATPTVTPTGTLTPTLSPTVTPTGVPTNTPPPGSTPTPTIIVVRPTLPPTGPSNTIVAIGLVGVAISVLGLALLIGI